MKNLKSYVRASLGLVEIDNFNDFEKGVIYMERSRLDQKLPSRKEFEAALEFARNGVEGLADYHGPNIVKQVGLLSIELLEIQIEVLDKRPEETNWTYRKSMEVTLEDSDLCNRMDFLAGKLYQLMPIYSKEMELQYVKDWLSK